MLNNARREAFAQAIAAGKSNAEAYAAAGYKAKPSSAKSLACRLLKQPDIRARLDEIRAELAKASIATADEVQQFLTSVMRGQVTEETIDRFGEVVTIIAPVKERVKAAELLGRAFGIFNYANAEADGELNAIAEALANPPPPLN